MKIFVQIINYIKRTIILYIVCIIYFILPSYGQELTNLFDLGVTYYEKQLYNEAIEIFKKVINNEPNNPKNYYYLGLCLYNIGNYEEALSSFLIAKKLYNKNFDELDYRIALTYVELGEISNALDYFYKVLEVTQDTELKENTFTWIETLENNKIKEVIEDLKNKNEHFKNGLKFYEQQKFKEAEIELTNSLSEYIDELSKGIIYYYLGVTKYYLQKNTEAVENFNKVIDLLPKYQIARDANNFIKTINELNTIKPFNFSLIMGTGYDNNINYGYLNNQIADITSLISFNSTYKYSDELEAKINYLSNLNTNILKGDQNNSIYNIHSLSSLISYSFPISNIFQLENQGGVNWLILDKNTYFFNLKYTSTLNIFYSPKMITSIKGNLEMNYYPYYDEKNSFGTGIELLQYVYLWDRRSWFQISYNYKSIVANDFIKSDKLNEYSLLKYRYSNSYNLQKLGLSIEIPLFFNDRININSNVSFLNYINPEIFQEQELIFNPIENREFYILKRELNKYRYDSLLELGAQYYYPLNSIFTLSIYYNYTLNLSNITSHDYYIDRSYDKNLIGVNLIANF